jgi:hypothetical protein
VTADIDFTIEAGRASRQNANFPKAIIVLRASSGYRQK